MIEAVNSPEADTRERILRAAMLHFSSEGYAGASVRAITQDAEANLAAVNYHFGSKLELMKAVVRYHVNPVNEDRMRRLEALRKRFGKGAIPVQELVEALLRPMALLIKGRSPDEAKAILNFSGRLLADSRELWAEVIQEVFFDIVTNFMHELSRSLPKLPEKVLWYRWQLMIGTMIGTLSTYPMKLGRPKEIDVSDFDAVLTRLRNFAVAGMIAPLHPDE